MKPSDTPTPMQHAIEHLRALACNARSMEANATQAASWIEKAIVHDHIGDGNEMVPEPEPPAMEHEPGWVTPGDEEGNERLDIQVDRHGDGDWTTSWNPAFEPKFHKRIWANARYRRPIRPGDVVPFKQLPVGCVAIVANAQGCSEFEVGRNNQWRYATGHGQWTNCFRSTDRCRYLSPSRSAWEAEQKNARLEKAEPKPEAELPPGFIDSERGLTLRRVIDNKPTDAIFYGDHIGRTRADAVAIAWDIHRGIEARKKGATT